MKKLFMTILTILTCGAAYALPVGNPADASLLCDGLFWQGHCGNPCDPCLSWCDAFSLRAGFYGDYVFNRHLEVDTNESDADIENTELFTNAGLIVANFWDRLDVFATLGATNLWIDTNGTAFGNGFPGSRIEIATETAFSWSIGLRGTIWECGCTSIGAEAQYFSTRPDIERLTVAATTTFYPDDVDVKYREWQIGVGISHRINIFVPYIAVKWSRAKLDFDDATFPTVPEMVLVDTKSKKDWGYAVGLTLIDCEKASVTGEVRFGDEKAVHVNAQIRF